MKTQKEKAIAQCVIYGAIAAVIINFMSIGLFSLLISEGKISDGGADVIVITTIFLSVTLGAGVAAVLRKRQTAIVAAITSAIIAVVLLGSNIMFLNAKFSAFGIKFVSVILGGAAASFIAAKIKTKR